jgi:hypothetical protein
LILYVVPMWLFEFTSTETPVLQRVILLLAIGKRINDAGYVPEVWNSQFLFSSYQTFPGRAARW